MDTATYWLPWSLGVLCIEIATQKEKHQTTKAKPAATSGRPPPEASSGPGLPDVADADVLKTKYEKEA
ncbi:hypothetical protein, partial [Acetobacter fabarum]|uniref:hypothetical protein n=1 Tax=Acetobacter fabarum TaxID=483199 RepID=UPI001A7E2899